MKELIELFLVFAKCGVCTFGGGYAMLPILQRELVSNRGWVTDEEITDYYAVGQCTPGIIAVNVATFIGMKKHGWIGAVFSTLGVIFPSIVIITLIAALLTGFADNEYVAHALGGIRASVCALVAVTVTGLLKKSMKTVFGIAMGIGAFLIMLFFDVSPVLVVVAAALIGIFYSFAQAKAKTKKEDGKDA